MVRVSEVPMRCAAAEHRVTAAAGAAFIPHTHLAARPCPARYPVITYAAPPSLNPRKMS